MIVAILLWSIGNVLTRFIIQWFSPETVACLRYITAALALLIYAAATKMRLPDKSDIKYFIFGGFIGFALYVYMFNYGARTLTASVCAFILSSSPVVTAVLARIILKEKMGIPGIISVAVAFSGVALLTLWEFAANPVPAQINIGIAYMIAAVVLVSGYNILQRKLLKKYRPIEITAYCIAAGALMLLIFLPQSVEPLLTAHPGELMVIAFLGVFGASLAYMCWACALNLALRTSEVTNYMFLTPVASTVLGFIIMRELPHFSAYIGGALILSGVLLHTYTLKQPLLASFARLFGKNSV
jgi:drug/metabolite transporter (DMT)-like permease